MPTLIPLSLGQGLLAVPLHLFLRHLSILLLLDAAGAADKVEDIGEETGEGGGS